MAFLLWTAAVVLVSIVIFKFLRAKWVLQQLNIPDIKRFPLAIEVFYPIVKLGLMSDENRFQFMAKLAAENPDMLKFWLGPRMTIMVQNPDRFQKILMSQKCIEKWNLIYGLVERDHGLIAGSAKRKWKDHRKFFNFSFSLVLLEKFLPTFLDYSEILCKTVEKEVNGKYFDFLQYTKRTSFNIICATVIGTNMKDDVVKAEYEKFYEANETVELALGKKISLPFIYPHTFYKFTQMYRDEQEAAKYLDEFQYEVFKARKEVIKEKIMKNNNEVKSDERNIIIDQIILNEEKFDKEEIRDHILTFMSGYETWSISLANAMLMLAMYPEVQEKLYQEICTFITSDEDLKSSENINKLVYLNMVQKEVFRLLPSVPMVLRETLEDFEIEPGLVIPKDVNLILNFYALHRRKDIWGENANLFDPERFSKENSKGRHPFAFLPFSSGSRICIAFKYSILSLKIAMIKLIQNYTFTTPMKLEDLRYKSYISLKLISEHLIAIEKLISWPLLRVWPMFAQLKKFFLKVFYQTDAVPSDYLRSQWQSSGKSLTYVAYRLFIAVFFTASVAFSVVTNIQLGHFRVFFIYLTHLNLCGTLVTAWLGVYLASLHYFNKLKVYKETTLLKTYSLLWNQSIVLSVLVSAFYWAVIYKDQPIDTNNVLIHITNSLILAVDLLIVGFPVEFSNVIGMLVAELIYMLFTVAFQLFGGLNKNGENFVYSTIDWKQKPRSTAMYSCLLLTASVIVHIFVNFVHGLRRLIRYKFVSTGVDKKVETAHIVV